jgi:small glutamine-rich tetratricopeptide repeat-containing protein alpha
MKLENWKKEYEGAKNDNLMKKVIGLEELKTQYEEAIQHYTDAIEISSDGPNSHIYYSNRAAAYCLVNDYELAAEDCESSIALKSDFAKAYSRLGLCCYHLNRYNDAVSAYEKLVEIEPENAQYKEDLRKAKKKAASKLSVAKSSSSSSSPSSSEIPDLSSLAGGIPPGLAGMMNNNPKMKQVQYGGMP